MAFLVFLVLLLAMTGYSNAAYCLCEDGVSEQVLQKAIDYASAAGADCSRISQNGSSYQLNTVKDHCSFAVISYYQNKSGSGSACDFSGAATLSSSPPSGTSSSNSFSSSSSLRTGVPGTTPPASTGSTSTGSIGFTTVLFLKSDSDAAYCLCEDGVSEQILQKAIDYASAAGADCSRISQNGSCYQLNTVKDHCSFAVISYYQNKSGSNSTCDFSGAATLSSSPPPGTSSSNSFSSSSRIFAGTSSSNSFSSSSRVPQVEAVGLAFSVLVGGLSGFIFLLAFVGLNILCSFFFSDHFPILVNLNPLEREKLSGRR